MSGGRALPGRSGRWRRAVDGDALMAKVRVFELAQEIGIGNKELLSRLQELGIRATNHMSSLEPDEVHRARTAAAQTAQGVPAAAPLREERIRGTIIRRRSAAPGGGVAAGEAEPTAAARPAPAEPAPVAAGPVSGGIAPAGEAPVPAAPVPEREPARPTSAGQAAGPRPTAPEEQAPWSAH